MYGREIDGHLDEFAMSGYLHQNTLLVWDKRTSSLWWPLDDEKWTAVSGPRKGEVLPFLEEPQPITLGEWRAAHPETVVLLGDRKEMEAAEEGEP